MTLRVEVVVPDGEVWSGRARMVVAKTRDGDVGILTGHEPVLAILAEGSLVRILDPEDQPEAGPVTAAVHSGFLSVAGDRVSVLAARARLGSRVDRAAVKASLAPGDGEMEPEPTEVRYAEAQLRAAGDTT